MAAAGATASVVGGVCTGSGRGGCGDDGGALVEGLGGAVVGGGKAAGQGGAGHNDVHRMGHRSMTHRWVTWQHNGYDIRADRAHATRGNVRQQTHFVSQCAALGPAAIMSCVVALQGGTLHKCQSTNAERTSGSLPPRHHDGFHESIAPYCILGAVRAAMSTPSTLQHSSNHHLQVTSTTCIG